MKSNLHFKRSLRSFLLLFILANFSVTGGFAQIAGNTLLFDGVDDVVIIPSTSGDELNPEKTITVECWVVLKEKTSANHRPHLIAKNGSYGLIIEDVGLPRFFIFDDQWYYASGLTKLELNKWYHITGTYDGDSIRVYVNGKLDGPPVKHEGSIAQNDNDLRIGNRFDNEEASNAKIDEVRIWSRTRSESQIQHAMNTVRMNDTLNLSGYWHFDESKSSIAVDSSSWKNDGILTKMDTTAAWVQSTVPVGTYSMYSISNDISRNTDVTVDVIFGTDNDAPGDNYALTAIQINDSVKNSTGLDNVPKEHWQLWSENSLFDGTFSATVNFHYDNIFGIQDENKLELYRRQNAKSQSWEKIQGYTINTGSSATDGKGYIQWKISQDTVGGYSGQYIVSSGSDPLTITEPDQEFKITLYPNPNHGSFEVGMNLEKNQNIDIEVYSMNGKVIWKEIYLNQMGNRKYPIDIKEQAKGIYFLRVTTESGSFTKQLIIQ